ncbi:MAG: HAMP domain-containing histidine kinase [Deltaproteobacteria bacterium]|nr:HAMP domain-containing histidine kinase [Deltaproteobacteria bacterium]
MPQSHPETINPLSLLSELSYPEYRNRHIFTARLRLILVLAFVFLYVWGLQEMLPISHPATIALVLASAITVIAYYNIIINGQWMAISFIAEVLADIVGISIVTMLLGGVGSLAFLLYFCYTLAGGLFYNYRVATTLAVASLCGFFLLSGLTFHGVLGPHHGVSGWMVQIEHGIMLYPLWVHPLLLALFLLFAIYGVKIGHDFSQHRERILEARNRELMALQRIGGMIRTTAPLSMVADRVVQGLVEGLDFVGSLLFLADARRNRFLCHPPASSNLITQSEQLLGIRLRDLSLPMDAKEHLLIQQILERKILFRRQLTEILQDAHPRIPPERIHRLQTELDIRKIVVIPLVAEEELLGALVGFSQEGFVEERAVATLETFANQAALVLRVTFLIDELKGANRELLEANRVKSEFLATMSHELRTPLTAIIGFSELLIEGAMGTTTKEQQESLREILNNGANLLSLINNLLDLAKAESGRLTLQLSRFDLRELLERTQRTLGSLLARKHHHFDLQIPRALPPIEADERRIQQVLLNLLGNAIKFTDDGGNITVRTLWFERLDAIRGLHWQPHLVDLLPFRHGGVLIQVSDTGIGIPHEHLRSIFEMFKQVDSSVTRRYEGTGLGLALVRQLIDMHRGTIWAESAEGQGTTFNALLPIVHPALVAEDEAPPLPQPPVATIRVPV